MARGRTRADDDGQGSLDLSPSPWPAIRSAWCRRLLADAEVDGAGMFAVAWLMAEHVNSATGVAFPALTRLAGELRVSDRLVRRHVGALAARGHLIAVGQRPRSRVVEYRLARPDEPLQAVPDAGQRELFPATKRGKTRPEAPPPDPGKGCDETAPIGRPRPIPIGRLRPIPPDTNRTPASYPLGRRRPIHRTSEGTSEEETGCAGGGAADGVSDREDFAEPAAVAAERQRRHRRESAWRALLVTEPVVAQPDASPLHRLIDEGTVTEADVEQGVRDALAKDGFRPKHWASLVGWARGAASRRLAGTPREPGAVEPGLGTPPGAIPVPGGGFRSREQFAEARRRWDEGHRWDEAQFGDAPDSEFTHAPEDLRGPRRRRAAG